MQQRTRPVETRRHLMRRHNRVPGAQQAPIAPGRRHGNPFHIGLQRHIRIRRRPQHAGHHPLQLTGLRDAARRATRTTAARPQQGGQQREQQLADQGGDAARVVRGQGGRSAHVVSVTPYIEQNL